MVAYARSDLMAVTRSVDSGGCGHVHSRPVIEGAPVRIWALACPLCQVAVLDDPLWSSHPDLIPKTADEERASKRLAEEGTTTMNKVAEALAINAARILHESDQGEIEKAAHMAQVAAAAEAERAAAEAERAQQVRDAQLREAERVANAAMKGYDQVQARMPDPVGVVIPNEVPATRPQVVKADTITKGVTVLADEVHPSRLCEQCGGNLTRKAHSTGRWAGKCLNCRGL